MSQYAIYIWPCYIAAFTLLALNVVLVWLEWRQVVQQLRRRLRTE